jgi:hypothetical protein
MYNIFQVFGTINDTKSKFVIKHYGNWAELLISSYFYNYNSYNIAI